MGNTVLIANPAADLYGSDRMVLEAVRGLVGAGHNVVFTATVDGPLLDKVRAAGAAVEVLPAPVVRKAMLSPLGFMGLLSEVAARIPRMCALARKTDAQAILVNTVSNPFWNVAARLAGVPVVVYVHEAEGEISPALRKLLLAPLHVATGAIYNSETSRDVSGVASLKRRGRTLIVHNGVEGPAQVVVPRPELDSPLRVAFVGRLSPRKGPDLLLGAAAILRDRGIRVEVELIGDVFPGYEWYKEELLAQVDALDVSDRVVLSGFQPSVWDSIARNDVMVVPSRYDESFGNVVIESVLSARPVVVAEHSGLRESSAGLKSAVRVKPLDAGAIADGLVEIQDNWPTFRKSALTDAKFASVRYAPTTFQRRLVDAMYALTPLRKPTPVAV